MIRTYSNLIEFLSFDDRFRYLMLKGVVGEDTFGYDRYLNQQFYRSDEWRRIRDYVIIRDNGCDLGIPDREIHGRIIIHHLNSITEDDILQHSNFLVDPEYLICTTINTHNAIHYGDESILRATSFAQRSPNDTSPWRL